MLKPDTSPRVLRPLFLIVLFAFVLRVAMIPFTIGDITDSSRDHWHFGNEEGRIARSIATGAGFSSPLFGDTGPTAWTTPVYPYLLAGVFRILGIYSTNSAWVILILNSLFSALTCIPLFFIGKRCFDKTTALWASAIWAIFPYAIFFASTAVWDYCLDTLMLALVVWCTLAMARETRMTRWAGYGILWGVAALSNAVALSTLPFLLGWLAWRRAGSATRWLLNSSAAILLLILTVFPWFLRNYSTFHHPIPFRSTFWMIFWEGNTGDISDLYPDWSNPAHNTTEMEEYRRLGELGYVQQKKLASLDFVKRYPGLFFRLTMRRFLFTWTGFWTLRRDYLAGEPFAFPNIAMNTILTLLFLLGARRALHSGWEMLLPLLLVLASYPVVYYVTHPGTGYRLPMDAICAVFIAYLLQSGIARRAQAGASTAAQ